MYSVDSTGLPVVAPYAYRGSCRTEPLAARPRCYVPPMPAHRHINNSLCSQRSKGASGTNARRQWTRQPRQAPPGSLTSSYTWRSSCQQGPNLCRCPFHYRQTLQSASFFVFDNRRVWLSTHDALSFSTFIIEARKDTGKTASLPHA